MAGKQGQIANNENKHSSVVLHTGMHRSGTSLMASGLNALGVFMGDKLISPKTDNPKGFFEDLDILLLHRALLESFGEDPDHGLTLFGRNDFFENGHSDHITQLESVIVDRCKSHRLWGVKDPRLCLLLPLWLPALKAAGATTRIIFSLRNPLDVARSLNRRNGFTLKQGLLMWLQYVYSFACNVGEHPVLVVSYENILDDPEIELKRAAKYLQINFDSHADTVVDYCSTFVDKGLRHHQSSPEELCEASGKIPVIKKAYEWLQRKATEENERNDWQELAELLEGLNITKEVMYNLTSQDIHRISNSYSIDATLRCMNGADFSGQNSFTHSFFFNSGTLVFDTSSVPDINRLQFEPCQAPCAIRLLEITVTYFDGTVEALHPSGSNALSAEENLYVFSTPTPKFFFDLHKDIDNISLSVEYEAVGTPSSFPIIKALSAQQDKTQLALENLQAVLVETKTAYEADAKADHEYINALQNSLSWKVTAPLRFGYDVIAAAQRSMSAKTMFTPIRLRKMLETIRWSRGGNFLYSRFVPALVKDSINRKWVKGQTSVESAAPLPPTESQSIQNVSEPAASAMSFPSAVKALAFYLPQFHPIPENDQWWGEGFTEWTNVAKALPMFQGHDQPKYPTAMGYYDLRLPEVMRKQSELAKQFGIHGFCFHHYDFSGRRVLETPVDNLLKSPDIDIPFCLCWANENWTRRWDGADEDVLLAQDHSPEDDIRFIEAMARYFADPRYIRIEGKPFFIVYKPEQLPNAQETLIRWRRHWNEKHGEGLYIAMAQSFGAKDPREWGFDVAIQFPPHNFSWTYPRLNQELTTVPDFAGHIFEYEDFAASYVSADPEYTLYKTVCPSWDNTARRGVNGIIYANSTPAKYKSWLKAASEWTVANHSPDEAFVFINAWNEWAEGAYLEPDRTHGYAYLNATSQVLAAFPQAMRNEHLSTGKVLFISHDAHIGGAQKILLSTLEWLAAKTSLQIYILCLAGGPHIDTFSKYGQTTTVEELGCSSPGDDKLSELIVDFCEGTPNLIYGNTVAAGRAYQQLCKLGVPIVTHIHELEESIRIYASDCIDDVLSLTSHFIACSPPVEANMRTRLESPDRAMDLICEHINTRPEPPSEKRKRLLRKQLGLPHDSTIIMGCGLGLFWRKGADLYIEVARKVLREMPWDTVFYWVGDFDMAQSHEEYGSWQHFMEELEHERLDGLHFVGRKSNALEFIEAADVFVLPSREDPFPLVCLEAAERAVPIVCFDEAGGMPSFVEKDCGIVVPLGDVDAMATAVISLLNDGKLRDQLGKNARQKVLSLHTVAQAGPAILEVIRKAAAIPPVVSVIVPNYNKQHYLEERLESIFSQSYQDIEVIILDDGSTDGSCSIIDRYSDRANVSVVKNERNQGVFAQWKKGIDLAKGDLIWIAEADDSCSPDFLERLLPAFSDEKVKLAYSESQAVDGNSNHLFFYGDTDYLKELSKDKWKTPYSTSAEDEVTSALAFRNTIPNASAVVFRKFDCTEWYGLAKDMKLSGDWLFYLYAIRGGKVSYVEKPLNRHRRYDGTSTQSNSYSLMHFEEFVAVQHHAHTLYELSEEAASQARVFCTTLWDEMDLNVDLDKEYRRLWDKAEHRLNEAKIEP
ncbi:glycoside hydrolase family 99-like domain-containing protein [uncultured Pseudodesulfovibrio sp.]|uniref:glycoside hydrolase family 99-like domain-containing protein n=1 Tax=uncultured Pseudodesulfovibrio sp. TaxID=2035858 RepID=UPI0029C6D771|nr:glycoside hydrolase family 99-like domain-containing protein [uncultured Pseudodesulfovibrio sp.]